MKQGTPGFNGHRLREAREARGFTASSLADLLGVTRSAVSQYELSIQSPRPEILERACKVLNLPASFFVSTPDQEEAFSVVYTRSMSAMAKTGRMRATRRLEWVRKITQFLKSYVEIPALSLPEIDLPFDPRRISSKDIESAAMNTRLSWGIGEEVPIANLVRSAENNGFVVVRDNLEPDPLKAISAWDKRVNQPYIIVGSHVGSGPMARYETARQIGHLILHRTVTKQQLSTNNEFSLLKDQASRFAAALLLPSGAFTSDLYSFSLDAMRLLKHKWRTPIAVMIRRLEHLEVISEEQAKKLWIGRSRRGWQNAEPLDDEIPTERPRLLSESVMLLVDEQVLAKSEILAALPFSDRDVEKLAGLDQGYLTDSMPVISIIPADKRRVSERPTNPAEVVSFPTPSTDGDPRQRKFR